MLLLFSDQHPFLPNENKILKEMKAWDYSQVLNDIYYISDGHVIVINWVHVMVVVITAFLFQMTSL